MIPKEVEHLIAKYLVNEATSEDLDSLSLWISNPDNETIFYDYVKTYFEVTLVMNKPDADTIKKNLLDKIKKDKNPFRNPKFFEFVKYAAILIMVFGLGYLYHKSSSEPTETIVENETLLVPKEDVVTIELEDGLVEELHEKESKRIKGRKGTILGVQNKSSLAYDGVEHIDRLIYNTLNVPKGKRFDVVLSDGSHVYLNAGTSLKYPVKFLKGQPRNVFLTGEAYFDVAEDKKHPFTVHVDELKIKVLGTQFNVNHYPENENINTVLIEGAVELFSDEVKNDETILLEPGNKAAWDKKSQDIAVEKVNTRIYTAWLDGKLIFRNTTFKQIRHALERHYNVTIKNENALLDEQRFDATFDIETINEILETFNKSYAIEYSIIDNEVLIR